MSHRNFRLYQGPHFPCLQALLHSSLPWWVIISSLSSSRRFQNLFPLSPLFSLHVILRDAFLWERWYFFCQHLITLFLFTFIFLSLPGLEISTYRPYSRVLAAGLHHSLSFSYFLSLNEFHFFYYSHGRRPYRIITLGPFFEYRWRAFLSFYTWLPLSFHSSFSYHFVLSYFILFGFRCQLSFRRIPYALNILKLALMPTISAEYFRDRDFYSEGFHFSILGQYKPDFAEVSRYLAIFLLC